MSVESTDTLSHAALRSRRYYSVQVLLLAGLASVALHVWLNYIWHAAPVEPLSSKPPQTIEVSLITPPIAVKPKLEPVPLKPKPILPKKIEKPEKVEKHKVKPIQKSIVKPTVKSSAKLAPAASSPKTTVKSIAKPVVKPAIIKSAVKNLPKAMPKPVIPESKSIATKAQAKVTQKTFTRMVPNVASSAKAKITAPVLTPPKPQSSFNTPFNTATNAKAFNSKSTFNSSKAPIFSSNLRPSGGGSVKSNNNNGTGNQGNTNKSGNSSVIALGSIKPKYPRRAQERHIEGSVTVEFSVTASGSVDNAVVISANPASIFNDSALNAIQHTRFKPKMVNGVAVQQDRVQQTIRFKLE